MSFTLSSEYQKALEDVYHFFVPNDNAEQLKKYEKIGGTCGPSTIAVIEKTTIAHIIENWCGRGPWLFKGYSPIGDMKDTLGALGWSYKYIRAHKAKEFPTPSTDLAILRIQWIKDDGTEYYWRAAGAHTHYVLMQNVKDTCHPWWIFCNGAGWFEKDSKFAKEYLTNKGYVSSYLELTNEMKK